MTTEPANHDAATDAPQEGAPTPSQPDAPAVPGYLPVPAAALVGEPAAEFPLHARNPAGQIEPLLDAGAQISPQKYTELLAEGHELLYVAKENYLAYRRRAESGLGDLLTNDALGPERFAVAWELASQLMEEALDGGQDDLLERTSAMARSIVVATGLDATVVDQMLAQRPTDYSTPGHMVCCGLCSLQLGQLIQLDAADLPVLLTGGLLMNVGMAGIGEGVLIKEGHLSPDEWDLVARHPRHGADWLASAGADERIIKMAQQHHERLDGKGIPRGLAGELITPWARLGALIDTYVMLTAGRPFRDRLTPARAAWLIESESGTRYETALARCWSGWVTGHLTREAAAEQAKNPRRAKKATDSISRAITPRSHMGVPRPVVPLEGYLPLPPMAPRPAHRSRDDDHVRGKDDRRSYPRYRMQRTCMVRCVRPILAGQHVGFWCETVEISRSGIQLIYPYQLGTGQVVSVFVPDPSGTAGKRMTAVVVHCRPSDTGWRIGARFDSA